MPSGRELLKLGSEILKRCGIVSSEFEPRLFLSHILKISLNELNLILDKEIKAWEEEIYFKLLAERATHRPIQYILKSQDFRNLCLKVGENVFIPRFETEILVEKALEIIKNIPGKKIVVDVGTGCGNIACSIASELGNCHIIAIDISFEALKYAQENTINNQLEDRITLIEGDLLTPLRISSNKPLVDMIISNPPYIRTGDIPYLMPEVRDFEPRIALDGGKDGLEIIFRLIEQAPSYLKPGGWLILEFGDGQAEKIVHFAEQNGKYLFHSVFPDLAGKPRIFIAKYEKNFKSFLGLYFC